MTYWLDFAKLGYIAMHPFSFIPSLPLSSRPFQLTSLCLHYFHHLWLTYPFQHSPSSTKNDFWRPEGCHYFHHSWKEGVSDFWTLCKVICKSTGPSLFNHTATPSPSVSTEWPGYHCCKEGASSTFSSSWMPSKTGKRSFYLMIL
jgi:hypothetical protein